YDTYGRQTAIHFAVGTADEAVQRFEYDAAGNRTALIDENGNRTEYEFDALNRLMQVTEADPDGLRAVSSPTTQMPYYARGNLVDIKDARGNETHHTYDELDRLMVTRDSAGSESTFAYDQVGNVVARTDPNGHTTRIA